MSYKRLLFKKYSGTIYLLGGIIGGGLLGWAYPNATLLLQPIGETYLDLLFIAVVPLIFFSISSAIAITTFTTKIGRFIGITISVYIGTILLAAIITILTFHFLPISHTFSEKNVPLLLRKPLIDNRPQPSLSVTNFPRAILSNIAFVLIVLSILIGILARRAGARANRLKGILSSGDLIVKHLLKFAIKLAPLGLGAYFACQVALAGSNLVKLYYHIWIAGNCMSLSYYFLAFSGYAFIAGGSSTVSRYWKNNISPSFTALSSCSSFATIPSNLIAAEKMGIPTSFSEVLIPLGAALHKEGSVIVTIVGLSLIDKGLTNLNACLLALIISLLVSVIEGSIPNGGYVGQLLIMSAYHLPSEVWPVLIIISTILDPVATLLNVSGATASGLIIARLLRNRKSY